MTLPTALGPGGEFDRIRALAALWKDRARGLGDDCAILEVGAERIALSVDMSVEGVHFRRDWLTPAEIGYRAAASALSDLAAVAAEPLALLLAVAMPADEPESTLLELGQGVGDAVSAAGAVVVGGDLSRGDRLTLDCCVVGRASAPVRRAGARPGDLLVVTGALGGPLAALTAWRRGVDPPSAARERFVHPPPRHMAARYLAGLGAHAMIDISDGFAADLGQLLVASGVGARVDVDRLPVHPDAAAAALAAGESAWSFAARSGEEYELVAALPAGLSPNALAAAPAKVTVIGVVEAELGLRAMDRGVAVRLAGGWDHFGKP